jgi:rhodanese-related sulfurtransferase
MKKLLATILTLVSATALVLADDAFPNISTDELKQAIAAKKVVLLDVNGTESWQEGHIPGALDFDKVEGKLAKMLPADKDTLVVAYCGNERCSAYKAGAAAAKKLGYTNVKHYSKGISGWKKAGEKTDSGS